MSVGLSKDQFSAGPISALGNRTYTDSTGDKCHLRLGTCHWDHSVALSENVPKLKLIFALLVVEDATPARSPHHKSNPVRSL